MQATIVTIGDELLIGQVTDTNSPFIAKELNAIGIDVREMVSVHDSSEHITTTLRRVLSEADIVVLTGGLGPTKDDITKKTLCDFFKTELVPNEKVKKHIETLYFHRQKVLNDLTATQWLVPKDAEVLPNRIGSAPLMVFNTAENKIVFSLPGVPLEMEIAMREQVIPYLNQWLTDSHTPLTHIRHVNIIVSGLPESALALLIQSWEEKLPPFLTLAYLPANGKITLRLSAHFQEKEKEKELAEQIAQLKQLVAPYFITMENFL